MAILLILAPTQISGGEGILVPPPPVVVITEKIEAKNKQVEQPVATGLIARAKSYDGQEVGQCVVYIQYVTGAYSTFKGVAGKIKPNTQDPQIGHAVITREGTQGHVALVIDIIDNKLILADSNYNLDGIVHIGRELPIGDEIIIGYFNFKPTGN